MKNLFWNRFSRFVTSASVVIYLLVLLASCEKQIATPDQKNFDETTNLKKKTPQLLKDFTQVNLIGDEDEYEPMVIDPNLVNAWGLAFSPGGVAWISSEVKGLSLVYNVAAAPPTQLRPPVAIPSPSGPTGGAVTGAVFNGTTDFVLSNGGGPARFIFDGLDGVLSAWNGVAGNFAVKVAEKPGAVYTGLAINNDGTGNFLYAANFASGHIDVYDNNFMEVSKPFMDPGIPAGYSPFNIQSIGGWLYVMYAKVDPEEHEEEKGPGLGYVSIFNPDGSFVKRFISKGQLNAPWGIAQASAGFFGDGSVSPNTPVTLVGNFGDGHINAFDSNGDFIGQLRQHGQPIVIEGLWAISFAPATATTIDPNRLFFAAGPDDEEHGLFGYITK